VEVKNVRSWIYPWSHEAWDLLAKLGGFPDVVPLLVARRIHPTTFRMFKDLGAFGYDARKQWFAERGGGRSNDPDTFRKVTDEFGFHDAVLLDRAPEPEPGLTNLFSTSFTRPTWNSINRSFGPPLVGGRGPPLLLRTSRSSGPSGWTAT
jgi:hypothetical protein